MCGILHRLSLIHALFLLLIISVLVVEASAGAMPERIPHPRKNTLIKRLWGVEVLGVRESAAGYMLEFRYKVIDEEKAGPLFVRKTKPVLIHEATGARLVVPEPAKTGPLRNSNPPIAGQTYWMFFTNPGRFVKQGDVVSVVIGEFSTNRLVVH